MRNTGPPQKQGLYDPKNEHDSCGIGFVAHIKGVRSNSILRQALEVLVNLDHRGARGAEPNTGDGAGILMQIPDRFLRGVMAEQGVTLPPAGSYGVGMVFLSRPHAAHRHFCETAFASIARDEGLRVLGWRDVPTDNSSLGEWAKEHEPVVRQVFVSRSPELADELAFERKLYVIGKRSAHEIRHSEEEEGDAFYLSSLSCRTVVYKGMLTPEQVSAYYPDLSDPRLEAAIVLVHSRFSTNTFPSWERAHPYRYVIHNGEINTLRGNVNWMKTRQSMLESDLFGKDLQKLLPILEEDGSDSAIFDNCLEFLHLSGRSLAAPEGQCNF
ncbi:MAG: hypothetical protein IH961_09645 [Chloroflexi bacterium]|nr:hypothetical protein [Chloroflexota bacterium]